MLPELRPIDPKYALGLLFAALTVLAVIANSATQNGYYLITAGALGLVTYAVCPPPWVLAIGELLSR